jgi:Na+/H+ antiporter NhaC
LYSLAPLYFVFASSTHTAAIGLVPGLVWMAMSSSRTRFARSLNAASAARKMPR